MKKILDGPASFILWCCQATTLCWWCLLLCWFFSFFLPLRFRIGAGIVAIISFALIVGLSATVVRASIMAALVLIAQVFGRRYDVLRALILAGWLMIILNPYLLVYDVGFQLSFMATLGLILIVPQLEASVINNFRGVGLKQFFLATVATQIAVLPILMFHIGEVSLISVLVNMLVLPVVPVAMLLTFMTGLVGLFFLPLASLVGFLASLSLDYILAVANLFGSLTYAAIPVPEFSIVGVIVMYIIIGSILFYRRDSKSEAVLNDWVIEEEFDEDNKKAATTLVTASSDKLPIFFR